MWAFERPEAVRGRYQHQGILPPDFLTTEFLS
jgi:hypothetical protein